MINSQMKAEWKSLTCVVSADTHRAIKLVAVTKSMTMAEVIEAAMKEYMKLGRDKPNN
jgi:hypothetical protein